MKTKGIVRWSATDRPDTKYVPHKWYIDISVSKDDAQALKAAGLKVKTLVNDETEEVTYSFRATRNVEKFKGRTPIGKNPKPVVVDSALNPYEGIIGKGSEVLIVHRPWMWKNKKGYSSDLRKVQIISLVPYAGSVVEDEEDKLEVIGEGLDKTNFKTASRVEEDMKREEAKKDKEEGKENKGEDKEIEEDDILDDDLDY